MFVFRGWYLLWKPNAISEKGWVEIFHLETNDFVKGWVKSLWCNKLEIQAPSKKILNRSWVFAEVSAILLLHKTSKCACSLLVIDFALLRVFAFYLTNLIYGSFTWQLELTWNRKVKLPLKYIKEADSDCIRIAFNASEFLIVGQFNFLLYIYYYSRISI